MQWRNVHIYLSDALKFSGLSESEVIKAEEDSEVKVRVNMPPSNKREVMLRKLQMTLSVRLNQVTAM